MGIGEVYILVMTFTWIATPIHSWVLLWAVQFAAMLGQPVFYSLVMAQVSVITAGWKPKVAKRLCWVLNIGAAMAYMSSWLWVVVQAAIGRPTGPYGIFWREL